MGHFMVKHLDRASKKTAGKICVGTIISTIALHLGVSTADLVKDQGGTELDLLFLRRAKVIGVGQNRRIYLLQKSGDHYPLPDPANTYIRRGVRGDSWLLNGPAHTQAMNDAPRFYEFNNEYRRFGNSDTEEEVDEVERAIEEYRGDENEDEEEEEEQPTLQRRRRDGAGTSRAGNRRSRDERSQDGPDDVARMLGRLDMRLQSIEHTQTLIRGDIERQDARWRQWDQEWEGYRNSWDEFAEQQREYFDRYGQYPPPNH